MSPGSPFGSTVGFVSASSLLSGRGLYALCTKRSRIALAQRRVADDFMPLEVAPDLADGLTLAIHIVTCALRSHSRARRVRLSAETTRSPPPSCPWVSSRSRSRLDRPWRPASRHCGASGRRRPPTLPLAGPAVVFRGPCDADTHSGHVGNRWDDRAAAPCRCCTARTPAPDARGDAGGRVSAQLTRPFRLSSHAANRLGNADRGRRCRRRHLRVVPGTLSCAARRSSRPTLPWITTTDVWLPSRVVMALLQVAQRIPARLDRTPALAYYATYAT